MDAGFVGVCPALACRQMNDCYNMGLLYPVELSEVSV